MSKFLFKIFFVFFASVLFYSCSNNEDTIVTPSAPENFTYPFTVNSNWFYKTTPSYIFHPDSVRAYVTDLDTAIESGFTFWKGDTIYNGINARILRGNHSSTAHAYDTEEFYVQTDTGLVNIGYIDDYGPGFGPFRPGQSNSFLYNGIEYSSIKDFLKMMSGDFASTDKINVLKYPITQNSEWFFRSIGTIQIQRKKYLGYETVETPAGTFNCIKIQRKNYTGNPEVLDTNYVSYDYFSKSGMVKRSLIVKNNPFYYNGAIIGYYDIQQNVLLNRFDIKP